jgi:hypothetical protein
MTRYTQGPWRVARVKVDGKWEVRVTAEPPQDLGTYLANKPHGSHIATINQNLVDEYRRNAELIALIPELLGALEIAWPYMLGAVDTIVCTNSPNREEAITQRDKVLKIIKKAKGE